MGSPVNADDFPPLAPITPLCQRLGALLGGYDAVGEFLDWFLNDSGEISDEALAGINDRMMPIGSVIMWCAATLPSDNWRVCNGQLVSRTTYATLFTRMGTVFGSGDGASNFALPNLTDRFVVGAGGAYARGATGGEAKVTLTTAQMPKHKHLTNFGTIAKGSGGGGDYKVIPSADGSTLIINQETSEVGADEAHENLPPYVGLIYIIKVS